jgi:hypothetical protein
MLQVPDKALRAISKTFCFDSSSMPGDCSGAPLGTPVGNSDDRGRGYSGTYPSMASGKAAETTSSRRLVHSDSHAQSWQGPTRENIATRQHRNARWPAMQAQVAPELPQFAPGFDHNKPATAAFHTELTSSWHCPMARKQHMKPYEDAPWTNQACPSFKHSQHKSSLGMTLRKAEGTQPGRRENGNKTEATGRRARTPGASLKCPSQRSQRIPSIPEQGDSAQYSRTHTSHLNNPSDTRSVRAPVAHTTHHAPFRPRPLVVKGHYVEGEPIGEGVRRGFTETLHILEHNLHSHGKLRVDGRNGGTAPTHERRQDNTDNDQGGRQGVRGSHRHTQAARGFHSETNLVELAPLQLNHTQDAPWQNAKQVSGPTLTSQKRAHSRLSQRWVHWGRSYPT